MVQIDVSLSAAVGATLAAAATVQLRSEKRLWSNGYLGAALVFAAFFVVPALLFFLGGWPAWDTMYWFDRETVPAYLAPLSAVTVLLAVALGFVAAHALILRRKEMAALALPGLFCLPAVAVMGAFYDRVLHVGSRASYAAGAPVNLIGSDLVWAVAVVIPLYVGLPLAIVVARWARPALEEQRARRRAGG